MPSALITGVSGQDGSYLAELLLAKGYTVLGTTRDIDRAMHALSAVQHRLVLYETALDDPAALHAVLSASTPDEIYHLAAQSRVTSSWADPAETARADGVTVAQLLEVVRRATPRSRVFLAGSCEVFADSDGPLSESSVIRPASPYGAAKLFAQVLGDAFRAKYDLFVGTGILFHHESPRRSADFVTRKISRAAASIARGTQSELSLGNLDARRDWGFAGDYVDAMWRMLQQDEPADYVIGTGEAHSVRELAETAFNALGLDYHRFVRVDPALLRSGDAPVRVADASLARARLGWTPTVSFRELVQMMVKEDVRSMSA